MALTGLVAVTVEFDSENLRSNFVCRIRLVSTERGERVVAVTRADARCEEWAMALSVAVTRLQRPVRSSNISGCFMLAAITEVEVEVDVEVVVVAIVTVVVTIVVLVVEEGVVAV